MQIPEFWAEARVEGKVEGNVRVVRRFGWSDESQAAAEQHAHERAESAMAERQAGHDIPNREPKLIYGGGIGLPIREEVIARSGSDVVTRNSYGARCLNEPDVMFADIDLEFALPRSLNLTWAAMVLLPMLAGIIAGIALCVSGATAWGFGTIAIGFVTGCVLSAPMHKLQSSRWNRSRHVDDALGHIRAWVVDNPQTRAAVYETPAGLRLLMLHRTFDPTVEATQRLFRELNVDPTYAQMCALQACFRARISAKPWRIGIKHHIYHSRGKWPIDPDRRPERDRWVQSYEAQAADYAACRYLEDIGSGRTDSRCETVQRMHDEMCKARSELPIA